MSIEKTLQLYQLKAEHFKESGFEPNQARIYKEMIDFMADCKTMEEATEKFKDSPYILGPGAALVRDRLLAFAKAAEELGMPEVVEVYLDKEKEIANDANAMYVAGYESKAQNRKMVYVKKRDAIVSIFSHYIQLLCGPQDEKEIKMFHEGLLKGFEELEAQGVTFEEVVKEKYIREVITLNDEMYASFVKDAPKFRQNPPKNPSIISDQQVDEVWAFMSNHKDEIKELGQVCLANIGYGECVVVSPSDSNGVYEYTHIVKED